MIILVLLVVITMTSGANILCFFTMPCKSHQNAYLPVCRELSLRGHNVTILTPNPLYNSPLTNATEIDLSFAYECMQSGNMQSDATKKVGTINEIKTLYGVMENVTITELTHPRVQTFINDKSLRFDVAIMDFFYPTMHALSAKFKCPLIGMVSMETFITGYDAVGNPSHPILNPDVSLPYKNIEWFWNRLSYTFFAILIRLHYRYYVLPKQDKVARNYISNDIPYLGDIEKNVSLLFINANPIIHSVRPNVPAVIALGSMYTKDTTPIPTDLQKELDAATQGAIYFSLGTNMKSSQLPQGMFQVIVAALSELPYTVFWKWESDKFPNKPKNIVLRKWFPQKSVLGHKNIRAFVMQGGLQSIEEAIFNQVPLIIIPFRIDQFSNAHKMAKIGVGKTIHWEKLSKHRLKQAILEVASKNKYREAAKNAAELIMDVPMTGLEKAIWWTEYVIRHKGALHLRSPAIDLPWHQYLLIDVILFVIASIFLLVFIVYKTIPFVVLLVRKIVHKKIKIE